MPRKLKITLWVAIGLLAACPAIIMVGYWAAMNVPAGAPIYSPFVVTIGGTPLPWFLIVFGLIFACGVLIVYWTQKAITLVVLKKYLLLAGASAMGMLFFAGPVHMLTEVGFVMALLVCPVALVVGVVLALRFKVSPQAS